ncbi:hypothetical protein BJX99DRAFT_257256 [Aspergillus californicus]
MTKCEYPLNLCAACLLLNAEIIPHIPPENMIYKPGCNIWIFKGEFPRVHFETRARDYRYAANLAEDMEKRLTRLFREKVPVIETLTFKKTHVTYWFMVEFPKTVEIGEKLQAYVFLDCGVAPEAWMALDTSVHPSKRRLQFLWGCLYPSRWNLFDDRPPESRHAKKE